MVLFTRSAGNAEKSLKMEQGVPRVRSSTKTLKQTKNEKTIKINFDRNNSEC
jgi:hypothetical protein